MEDNKILNDTSALTNIPIKTLNRISSLEEQCLVSTLYDQYKEGNKFLEANIGIGTLIIKDEDDNLQFKFIPSTTFKNNIVKMYKDETPKIINGVEVDLLNKVENFYKKFL